MKTIHKYPLEITEVQPVVMPSGAEIISVQTQHNVLSLWAIVETENPVTTREIWMVGTGQEMPALPGRFIGTALMFGGNLVWHVFANGQ